MKKINFSLDVFVNILVLLSFIILIVLGVNKYFFATTQTSNINEKALDVGQTLNQIKDLNETEFEGTLVIFLSSECSYCTKSIPFYKRLESLKKNSNFQIAVVFSQSKANVDNYITENHLNTPNLKVISNININQSKIVVTPTIIFIDKNRKILNSWFGYLSPEKEEEIINIIK